MDEKILEAIRSGVKTERLSEYREEIAFMLSLGYRPIDISKILEYTGKNFTYGQVYTYLKNANISEMEIEEQKLQNAY